MPYDKYLNWPLPTLSGNVFTVLQTTNIEEQVLKDLAETEDEIDKLEILDSYAAYAQRCYRERLAIRVSEQMAYYLGRILEPSIHSSLPQVNVVHRGRPVKPEK